VHSIPAAAAGRYRKARGHARWGHPDSRQVGRPPRTGDPLGRAVKPGRGPLRRGRRWVAVSGPRPPWGWPGASEHAGGLWQESGAGSLGNGGSRRRTGLIRRVPKRRSDGLPARDCWCGSDPGRAGTRCEFPPRPEPVPSPWRGGSLPPRPQPLVCHGPPGGRAARRCRTSR